MYYESSWLSSNGLIKMLVTQPTYLIHGCEEDGSVLARLEKWTGVDTTGFLFV
jgi:hypothetical protein